jgi:hypothetical protein
MTCHWPTCTASQNQKSVIVTDYPHPGQRNSNVPARCGISIGAVLDTGQRTRSASAMERGTRRSRGITTCSSHLSDLGATVGVVRD